MVNQATRTEIMKMARCREALFRLLTFPHIYVDMMICR